MELNMGVLSSGDPMMSELSEGDRINTSNVEQTGMVESKTPDKYDVEDNTVVSGKRSDLILVPSECLDPTIAEKSGSMLDKVVGYSIPDLAEGYGQDQSRNCGVISKELDDANPDSLWVKVSHLKQFNTENEGDSASEGTRDPGEILNEEGTKVQGSLAKKIAKKKPRVQAI
jgi:hypothetical protein